LFLEDLFSSVLSQFKKYHSSGNLKFDNLGIFQSLKLRNLMGKILRISLNPLHPSDANRQQKKTYFRESFQFSIVTIKKNITPLET